MKNFTYSRSLWQHLLLTASLSILFVTAFGQGFTLGPSQGGLLFTDMEMVGGAPFNDQTIYQSTSTGIIRKSINGGATWTNQTSGVSSVSDIDFFDGTRGWAVAGSSPSNIILRTTNGGTTWSQVTVGSTNLNAVNFWTSTVGWAVGDNGVTYKSTDGGINWTQQDSQTTMDLYDVQILGTSEALIFGERGIVKKTTDGGTTWTLKRGGTAGTPILYEADFAGNIGYAVGESGTIAKTGDGGNTWINQASGTTATLRGVYTGASSKGYACGDNGTVIKNSGSTWVVIPTGRTGVFYTIKSHFDFNDEEFEDVWIAGAGWGYGGTICSAPAITSQPQGITVCQGQPLILMTTLTGTVATIKWKRNGVTQSYGTDESMLVIPNASTSQAGNWEVVVTSPCGSITSNSVTVTVNPPQVPSAVVGANTSFLNVATAYSVSPIAGATFSWSTGTGGTVTGSGNAVQITWTTIGSKTISVTATDACGTSTPQTKFVTVSACSLPAQPVFNPSPSTSGCIGQSSSFSVNPVAGVSYAWTISGGGTISSSGNSATVNWISAGTHTVTVTPSNGCGSGTARTASVAVTGTPAQPSAITGNITVCTGVSTPYSITNVAGVTYTWSTGGGGTITGSGNAINVTWTSAGAKTLTVTPSTSCGNGTPRTLAVTVNTVPSQPSVIAGSTTVATGSSNQFSVTNEAGVTYAWNAGTGGTVTGSGNSVNISWSSAGSKTITLTPSNGCGNGTARTLNVTAGDCTVPSQPSTITGGATACSGAGATYSVTSVGGVSYAWNAGVDGSVVGSGNSVTLSWSSVGSKTVTVTPFNACGNGTPRTMNVTVSGSPVQPSIISGNATACKDAATAYSVTNVAGVTYTWDTGGKGTVSGSGNSVNVTWTNLGNNTLVVTPSNACGNGPTQTLAVVANKAPDPIGDITGNLSGCANNAIPFSVSNVSGVTYTWNGGAGSSASSTNSNPTITWNSAGSKTLTVTPSNACGNGTGASKTVEINSTSAQPSIISGSATPTAGVSEVYSVTPVSGTTYTWNGGADATVIGVGNSIQISWASEGSKTISVTPSNLCGAGTARTLNVTVGSAPCTAPSAPASIAGTTSTITGSTVAFTSALVAGATNYTFTVAPATGITITNTGNAHEKNITFANAGTYVVSAAGVNACGATSAPTTITVQICSAPAAQPTGLTSSGVSCKNKVQRYSVNVVDGFTYEWGATNGTITNVANGVADVTWSNAASGQVYVRTVTPCGFSSTYIYGPSETLIANPSAISLTNDLVGGYCDGKVITYTINNPEAGVNYTWVADRAVTTTATTVTATINGPMDIRLFATNACATNFPLSEISGGNPFPIPTTAPGIISGSLNPITGEITDYTIPNEGLPFGVRWNFGAGSSDYPAGTTSFQALFGTAGSKTITARYISNASCNVEGPAQTLNVVAVNPCVTPDQPGSISGLASVCVNTEYGFSVPFVADVDYTWSAGADATITGTSNNRTIKWTTGGSKTISVTASKTCGTSAARTLSVTVTAPPDQPATLTGSVSGCNGAIQQISLTSPVAGVTYTWEVQGGSVVTSGAQGQIADVTWTSLGVNQVKLKPSNSCGNGTPRTLDVTVGTVPDQPSFISGEGEVCSVTSKTYSVTNTSGVTYAWNAGSGGTVTGSGNSVSISWSTAGSKTITVTPSNACGNGTARTLIVNVGGVPAQPAAITGLASPTLGNEEAYAITSVAGVNYAWSLSDKGTLSASGNNASVFWSTPGSATLTVTPSNTCGNGTARTASITVNKISQTITFTVTSPMLANQILTLNGETSSGLPIAYTSSNTSIAEIFGNDLIIKEAGTINLTATQAGDETFAAATPVVRSLTINKANQVITFDALVASTFGEGSIELTGATDSGLSLTYSSSNTDVATVSGNVLTIVGAGTTNITATQGGDAIFNAATPVVRALVVNKADQSISFDPLSAKGINDPPFILTATASSELAVTYSSSNASVATITGSTVTLVGEGTTIITATQTGSVNYNAATPVEQTLEVNGKEGQTITFAALPAKAFGDADFELSATASSSLAVSYTSSNVNVATVSGTTVTIVGAGSTTLTASQGGNEIFNPATSVQQVLTVNKAAQTISFAALPEQLLSTGSIALSATSTAGLAISYSSSNTSVATVSGATLTFHNAGTTTITASQSGNDNFNAGLAVDQVLTITAKQSQTISFAALSAKVFGDAAFEVSASATSNLAVQFVSSNPSVATISGNVVSIIGAGITTITATQAGNDSFEAATNVSHDLVVAKANQTIAFSIPASVNFTTNVLSLEATSSAALAVSFTSANTSIATIDGNTLTFIAPGTVDITASQAGNANYNAANNVVASITIVDDRQTIALSGSLDFGNVLLGETAVKTITIANTGNAILEISALTLPEGFSSSVGATTVNVNASITAQITFAPTELREYTGSVVISSNAVSGDNSLALSGTGVTITGFNEPGQVAGDVDVYPNPGNGIFVVKSRMTLNKSIAVMDLSGKSQHRILKSLDEEHHELDLLDLPQGIYYLKIEEKGSVAVKRIVKLN